jgi:hypothetical protein
MAFDIKRKAELSLVAVLTEALPGLTFYPAKGGSDDGGSTLPKPPCGVIWIQDADKTLATEKTYLLQGTVVWVSRMEPGGTDVAVHSDQVRLIYDAILAIIPLRDDTRLLLIHGIDITTVNEFTDNERHAYGDTISFVMGASELD